MKAKTPLRQYVICVDNTGYAASLEKAKVYRVERDEAADKRGLVRVVDEFRGRLSVSKDDVSTDQPARRRQEGSQSKAPSQEDCPRKEASQKIRGRLVPRR